jgi:hypothetical protein
VHPLFNRGINIPLFPPIPEKTTTPNFTFRSVVYFSHPGIQTKGPSFRSFLPVRAGREGQDEQLARIFAWGEILLALYPPI